MGPKLGQETAIFREGTFILRLRKDYNLSGWEELLGSGHHTRWATVSSSEAG
jgi:hypothetical protein